MKKIFILTVIAFTFTNCSKKEKLSEDSVIADNNIPNTEIDDYIYQNFQGPYNINVSYNWKESDFEMKK